MNGHNINVVMCKPNRKAYITEINTSLESMQQIVGGLIEPYYLTKDVFLICNDEGKIAHFPTNRVIRDENNQIIEIINGTFFIAKDDGDENEESDGFTSLSDEEAKYYLEKYLYPDDIFLLGKEVIAFPYYEAEDGSDEQ